MSEQKVLCPDCGPSTINHFLSKTVLIIDWIFSPVNSFFMSITKLAQRFIYFLGIKNLGIYFFIALSKVGITKIVISPDADNSDRAKCLWIAAEERGIKIFEIRFFGKSTELFWCEYQEKKILFECLPRPMPLSQAYFWMDNKGIMRKKFSDAGLPIAVGTVAFRFSKALQLLKEIGAPLITKPNIGSRSRHTTIHISDPQGLKKAFKIAKKLSPWVIVEQELKGTVHRVTLIGGALTAVMRRDPPFVIGDGKSTIAKLIEQENLNPKRQGPHFHQIPIDEFTLDEISRQGLALELVPEKKQKIIIRNNIGRSSGGSNSDLTPNVHPENRELFEKIAKVVGDPLIGMDFIIEDVSISWKSQSPCGAIELNSVPFLDLHHFPLYGDVVDASGALWDVVFPSSASTKNLPK